MHGIDVVRDALDRPRLTALLGTRWERYVVSLVAGAGFGKSTALAQALRSPGAGHHDHVVRCDPSCVAESELARRIGAAFGVATGDIDALGRTIVGLPGAHCLVLDDVHHVDPASDGAAALADLVEQVVPAVRIVAASRRPLPLRLGRWRAAGQVLDIGPDELAFTSDELAIVADRAGTDLAALRLTEGWPALATLTARAGRSGAIEYLAEEVLDQLEPKLAEALDVAVLAGRASTELLEAVSGTGVDTDLLARAVPMLTVDAAGTVTPHDLWATVVEPRLLPDRRRHLLTGIATYRRARGDHRGALQAATRANDAGALADVVRDIGQLGHIALDLDEIEHWVARSPDAFRASAEGRLLLAIAARGRDLFSDATIDALAASWAELRQLGIVGCEVVAMSELAFAHRARGEPERMRPVIGRLLELDAEGHPECRALATFAKAGIAEQLGDVAGALAALESLREGDLSEGWMALVEFQRCNHLMLLGRLPEALAAARRARVLGRGGYLGGWCSELSIGWLLGGSRDLLDRFPIADELPDASQLDRIWIGTWFGALQAAAGQLDRAARNIAAARAALRPHSQPEFVGFLAWAEATYAVAEHDDARARRKVTEFLDEHPLTSTVGRRVATRAPALFAVLGGDDAPNVLRAHLTGAWQQAVLDVADALLALRRGEAPVRWPEPALLLPALPLPWAVELVARAATAGHSQATDLARGLTDVLGADIGTELARHDTGGTLAELFHHPTEAPVTVTLLGEVGVRGATAGTEELRRRRVRELLAGVALEGPIARDVAAERLWPGLDPERSAQNLRVTLTYLRRVRGRDGAPIVVEQEHGLALAPGVASDHARFVHLTAEAETARRAGATRTALDLYERALALVTGAPLTATARERWFEEVAERLTFGVAAAAVRTARLASALGEHRRAATAADLAIATDPYREHAHQLAIASRLALGESAAAAEAARRAVTECEQLGVVPGPDTARLVHEALGASSQLG